ncbi:protein DETOXIFICATION 43 [Henckelia pumila]|uniref:protein DETOXIFICATION 43 n=1 Tax=Henckelia pumila TaxID=405737 RepID=UPI003C6DEF2C
MADDIGERIPVASRGSSWNLPIWVFFKDASCVFKRDGIGMEILNIALPAAMALAADPIASLIDTAFIGHLGPVETAAVGVSIAIFNQASKITIFPLVSITTSFVAEEDTIHKIQQAGINIGNDLEKGTSSINNNNMDHTHFDVTSKNNDTEMQGTEDSVDNQDLEKDFVMTTCKSVDAPPPSIGSDKDQKTKTERRHIPSASTALLLGAILGLVQTIFLVCLAEPFLNVMGVKSGSPMLPPAHKYLTIRSLGAPAVLLSLAMQGVFRGFKDTKTPLYAIAAGDLTNIILDPIFIFACRLGVTGAAIAHVLSQYLISFILLFKLMKQVDLLPPSLKDLQLQRFLKNGFLLLARVIAVTICVTLSASMAARLGATSMAAFQICLQVWMTSSLLADGLAVAGQAILACAFAEKDYEKAAAAAARVLQMGFVLGLGLAVVVGLGLEFGSGIFTKDKSVVRLIAIGIPFVAATQPINSLAFVFDGVNFGASDFAYSAYSMVLVSIISIGSLFVLSKTDGFVGIWYALTIYMALRTFAGVWRMGTGTGPWKFLRSTRLLP